MVVQRIVNPFMKVRFLPSQLAILCLLLCSCEQNKAHSLPRDLGAYVTPLGIKVKFHPSFTADINTALTYVDFRACQWVAEKGLWGCSGYTDAELYAIARSELIVIYGGSCVPGDGAGSYAGFNILENRIEVVYLDPLLQPSIYDPAPVIDQYTLDHGPLYFLKHELTHSALGDWHP